MTSRGPALSSFTFDHDLARSSRRQSRAIRALVTGLLSFSLFIVGCASDEERVVKFLDRGAAYVEDGKDEEAIIEYKNVLQIDPENATAHESLSNAFLRIDKPREAYWEMSETVRVNPSNIDARLRYGTISAAVGDFDLSFEQANAVLELDSDNARAFMLRGQSNEQREKIDLAEADFRSAILSDPDAAAFKFLMAGFYERQSDHEKAEAVYRDVMATEKSYLALISLLRVVLRDEDRRAEIDPMLVELIELADLAPKEPRTLEVGSIDRGTTSLLHNVLREDALYGAYSFLAIVRRSKGDLDGAIDALEEGLQKADDKARFVYEMANFYRLAGRSEDENRMIRRATEEAPDDADAQLVLSAYLGRQGDLDGALEAAVAAVAVASDDQNENAKLREAELRVDVGFRDGSPEQIQQGREIVDAILASRPDSPEANFVKAKIELAENDFSAAKLSLEATLQARPTWAQARFVLGSALIMEGDLRRARVELESAIESQSDFEDARRLLVQVYAQLGEHEFAIEQGRAFLKARPTESGIRIIVGQSLTRVGRAEEAYAEISQIPEEERDAATHFALGRLDLAYGRIEEGAEKLRLAENLSPGNPQVIRALLAIDANQKQLGESEKRIAAALEANPEDSEIMELQAEVNLMLGKGDEAKAALEKAVETEPRNVSAQLALADLAARSGDDEKMLQVIERAAAAVPESSDLQYRLAQAYDHNSRTDEAIASYEKAITLNDDLALAKNNLAYLLAESGRDLDRALELAQEAKEQLPDDGNASDTLGWVLLKRGLPSAAIGYLQEAAERFPEEAFEIQAIVQNHLAIAYEENDEADNAVKSAQRALEFYERLTKAAKERGLTVSEPGWVRDSNDQISRLGSAS